MGEYVLTVAGGKRGRVRGCAAEVMGGAGRRVAGSGQVGEGCREGVWGDLEIDGGW